MRLILGSQSKSRREILKKLGYSFECVSPNVDEDAIWREDPSMTALLRARAKMEALLSQVRGEAVIITADQTVNCNGNLIDKPRNPQEAENFLRGYMLHPAETYTAIVVANTHTSERKEGIDIAKVCFKPIPQSVICELANDPRTLEVGGGFSVEDPRLQNFIAQIQGDSDSIMGLPIKLLRRLMGEMSAE